MQRSSFLLGSLVVLVAAAPRTARAQPTSERATPAAASTVRGVVYDSLLARPLAGASVWLEGASVTATTDDAGVFVLADVPAGSYVASFAHPELDDVGLPAPAARLTVPAAADVRLATPSLATLRARACAAGAGDDSRDGDGLLFGAVRDAATENLLAGARVVVSWVRIDTVTGRLRVSRPERVATTDSLGTYYVCGVPTGFEFDAVAEAPPFATGRVMVAVGARGLARLDLLVSREPDETVAVVAPRPPGEGAPARADTAAAPRGTASLEGTVRDSLGVPRAGARVTIDGVPGREARTDADGRFRLAALPGGSRAAVVRAIGYAPQVVPVALRPRAAVTVDVRLQRAVTVAGVTILARRAVYDRVLGEVAARQRIGSSFVIDSSVLNRTTQLRSAVQRAPFISTRTVGGDWAVIMRRSGIASLGGGVGMPTGECVANLLIDGRYAEWEEAQSVYPEDVLAVEVVRNPNRVPVAYLNTRRACGTVMIWTKWAR